MKKAVCLVMAAAAFAAFAGEGLTEAQEKVAKAGPKQLKLMIAGFGNIESVAQVDKWLGEQLQPNSNMEKPPKLSDGEAIRDPDLARDIVRYNWKTRHVEYIQGRNLVQEENARNRALLRTLRTKVLADDASRYVPIAKDYLQASLSEKAGSLLQVVDRSNADMNLVEQSLNGDNASTLAGATCILTAAMGDREEDSRTVTVNGKGTQVKITEYTQPYVGKVRDLQGNVLFAFKGTSQWSSKANSVVKSQVSDPARKLVEKACDDIAEKLIAFFTCKLSFKVKGAEEDDVTVRVDGKTADVDDGIRVLAVDHAVVATADGLEPVRKLVEIESGTEEKKVKLAFKKKGAVEE